MHSRRTEKHASLLNNTNNTSNILPNNVFPILFSLILLFSAIAFVSADPVMARNTTVRDDGKHGNMSSNLTDAGAGFDDDRNGMQPHLSLASSSLFRDANADAERMLSAEIAELKHQIQQQCAKRALYPCYLAPNPLKELACLKILAWNNEVEHRMLNGGFQKHVPPPSSSLAYFTGGAPLSEAAKVYACMDLLCLCPMLGGNITGTENEAICVLEGGYALEKAKRKEYRMLSEKERQKLHDAFERIKFGPLQEYNALAEQHQSSFAPAAHGGPAFLPWHREYLKRMEIALRRTDPTVALAYWDSSLDEPLDNPRDSIMWSAEFMGDIDADGHIADGKFKEWKGPDPNVKDPNKIVRLSRRLSGKNDMLFSREKIDQLLGSDGVEIFAFAGNCLASCQNKDHSAEHVPSFRAFELHHNDVHGYVGGQMAKPATAPWDPLFFLYHTHIDAMWEEWRQSRQTKQDQETVYVEAEVIKCCGHTSGLHAFEAEMAPFADRDGNPLLNNAGLSAKYTDPHSGLFQYEARPTCSQAEDCKSPYLFCWRRDDTAVCVSKIKPGGNCDKFAKNAENPCHHGKCIDGRCVASSSEEERGGKEEKERVEMMPATGETAEEKKREQAMSIYSKNLRIYGACEDKHECCRVWLFQGHCERNARYMSVWCPASCAEHTLCFYDSFDTGPEGLDRCDDYYLRDTCRNWVRAKPDECRANPFMMRTNCRHTCGLCDIKRVDACRDVHPWDYNLE